MALLYAKMKRQSERADQFFWVEIYIYIYILQEILLKNIFTLFLPYFTAYNSK